MDEARQPLSPDGVPSPAATGNSQLQRDAPKPRSRDYTGDHLAAVMKPVAVTMVFAIIVVLYVRDKASDQLSSGLNVYLVNNEDSSQSSSEKLSGSVINALVIVGVICLATFILVLCYYYRCLKVMVGYLIFASANLLGYTGGFLVLTALQINKAVIDWPSFVFLMYNFAVVGVVAVFWQKGIPRIITQGYLVCVSVIMAWIVTKLPEWTVWSLLVALALYDLCAVLTPCGPLRKLVELAQERQDPIPGLLYEAEVGNQDRNPAVVRDTFARPSAPRRPTNPELPTSSAGDSSGTGANIAAAPTVIPPRTASGRTGTGNGSNVKEDAGESRPTLTASSRGGVSSHAVTTIAVKPAGPGSPARRGPEASAPGFTHKPELPMDARQGVSPTRPPSNSSAHGTLALSVQQQQQQQQQQRSQFEVQVKDAEDDTDDEEEDDEDQDRSIKLGLGDFVFYSVLVSRAALFDVSSMAACFVAIIMGLASTLILLAVFKKALPALPISIFVGVIVYLLTRFTVVPFIIELSLNGVAI